MVVRMTSSHNQECIVRFEEASGRKDVDGSFVEPEVPASSEVPAIEPMHISDEASCGGFAEDLVPECPPPSDLDEPYEAESPTKTPPDVSLHESNDDEADTPPATA